MKWKLLLPVFLILGHQLAASLRDKDSNSTGLDDEAAEAIEFGLARAENFLEQQAKK